MSSKINSLDKLNKMLEFKSESEKERLEEEILHLKFIATIEEIMDQKDVNRTELGNLLNSSKSYVSQLFSGYKMINIKTLSKIQKALNVTFRIQAIDNKKFEFRRVTCSLHKKLSIKDYPRTEKDKLYSLSTYPRRKDKIPA